MDNLKYKIIAYLGRTPDFLEEVQMYDDGKGVLYIKYWNAKDKTKPTDEQLNALSSEATTLKNDTNIRGTRKLSYDSIGDQLDMLYKDLIAGKLDATGEWAKAIKKVKDYNPKS